MNSGSLVLVLMVLVQQQGTSLDAEGAISTSREEKEVLEQLDRAQVSKRIEGLSFKEEIFVFDGTSAAQPPNRTDSSFVPQSIIEGRLRRLRSVVRLTDALGELQCTGTLVRRVGLPPAILTAAHCLFDTQRRSHTGQAVLASPRTELWVGSQRLVLDSRLVTVSDGFRACANQRLTFRECVMSRGQNDVAFITAPFGLLVGPNAAEPWKLETAVTMKGRVITLGYGLNRTESPDEVLRGNLDATEDTLGCARWADAGNGQMVDFGDSGGPVITPHDDEALRTDVPTVIGVVSGQLAPGPFTLAEAPEQLSRFRARLQRPLLVCVPP